MYCVQAEVALFNTPDGSCEMSVLSTSQRWSGMPGLDGGTWPVMDRAILEYCVSYSR